MTKLSRLILAQIFKIKLCCKLKNYLKSTYTKVFVFYHHSKIII